jgi:hypothetical protein
MIWWNLRNHLVRSSLKRGNQSWARDIIQDAKKYGAPEGTMKQRKKPNPHSNYEDLMCDIVNKEPT